MRSMRSFHSRRSAIGLAPCEEQAARRIWIEERDAALLAPAGKALHGHEAGFAQLLDRALDVLHAYRQVVEPGSLAHDAACEFRALRVLQELDGDVRCTELRH